MDCGHRGRGFLLTLTALGAVGLNTRPHVQIPATAFIATIALWPVLPGALTEATRSRGFIDWLAFNAALMLLLGLVMYAVNTWTTAQALIQEYSK